MQAYHSRNRLKPMGMYINKGNNDFRDIVAHEYVDKTSLIPLINAMLNSENRYSCDTTEFRNDMRIIRSKNDVLTVLIHLCHSP